MKEQGSGHLVNMQQCGRAEGDPRLERGLRRDQARRERHLRGLTARAVGRQHPGVDRGTLRGLLTPSYRITSQTRTPERA